MAVVAERRTVSPRGSLVAWTFALIGAVALAGLVGFRLPSLWTVTLYNVTLADGTIRRSVFGTLLSPLWTLGSYRYEVYAAVAFAILGLTLTVILVAALRARWTAQRVLVLVWLLAPTGAFLFHEVGYLDQVVYLLLFASIWLWTRTSCWLAMLPVACSVLVHEMVLLTTWPVLVWFGLTHRGRGETRRRQGAALAVPGVLAAAVGVLPLMDEAGVAALGSRLGEELAFGFRPDAVELFGRSVQQTWTMYPVGSAVLAVVPVAVAIVAFWIWVHAAGIVVPGRTVGAILASCAPFALSGVGWDVYRWIFLGLSSFAVVVFLWLGQMTREPSRLVTAGLILPFALLLALPLGYFDGYVPRYDVVTRLQELIRDPDVFRIPTT